LETSEHLLKIFKRQGTFLKNILKGFFKQPIGFATLAVICSLTAIRSEYPKKSLFTPLASPILPGNSRLFLKSWRIFLLVEHFYFDKSAKGFSR